MWRDGEDAHRKHQLALTEFVAFLRLDSVRILGPHPRARLHQQDDLGMRVSRPSLLANPCLCVAEAVAELVGPFRRPELVCHHSVADPAQCWVRVVVQMIAKFLPLPPGEPLECRFVFEAPLRAWTMARASGSSASFRHAVWELSTPGIAAPFSPLSMQVVNTSSSSRTCSCKSPESMVSLPSLSSSSVSTTSSNVSHCADEAE